MRVNNTIRVGLRLKEGDEFFRSADSKIAVHYEGLEEWFDLPLGTRQITLVVSEGIADDADYSEESVRVYYYPSARKKYRFVTYDTFGLNENGMFESLYVMDNVMGHITERMGLPPQGVLNTSVEYEE